MKSNRKEINMKVNTAIESKFKLNEELPINPWSLRSSSHSSLVATSICQATWSTLFLPAAIFLANRAPDIFVDDY